MFYPSVNYLIQDRIFWIYFIIALFFIIIGLTCLSYYNNSYVYILATLWLLASIFFLIIIYYTSILWNPIDDDNLLICFVDADVGCLKSSNKFWLFINCFFIFILIFSVLWTSELSNPNPSFLKPFSGIIILISSLFLFSICLPYLRNNSLFYWAFLFFLLIWFCLTLYSVLSF